MEVKTVDDLIAAALKIKEKLGGNCPVGCWPYDGQDLHSAYVGSLGITEYLNSPVTVGYKPIEFPPYGWGNEAITENKTFIMIEHFSRS